MKTGKILISTDNNGLNSLSATIDHVSEVFTDLNEYLKANLDLTLNPEIAVDVLTCGGSETLNSFYDQQSKKLDKSGFSGAVKSNMLSVIKESMNDDLEKFQRDFAKKGLNTYDPFSAMKYISFDIDGDPYVSEENQATMTEQFNTYAHSPEHLELYEVHRKATEALNELRAVTLKHLPNTYFVSPVAFFSTFFEMDASEKISQKELNYKVF